MSLTTEKYRIIADDIPQMSYESLKGALQQLLGSMETQDSSLVKEVLKVVMTYTDYMDAPASTRFHLNAPHGLFKHSLGVAFRLMALDAAYGLTGQYSMAEIVLSGLLHDLGKAGQVDIREAKEGEHGIKIGNKEYVVKKNVYYTKRELKTKPGQFEYKRSKSMTIMSIPMGGLHFIGTMLSDVWKPSLDVWQAIGYHDGQYVGEGSHVAHAECQLLVALHHADYYQARVETEWNNGQSWK